MAQINWRFWQSEQIRTVGLSSFTLFLTISASVMLKSARDALLLSSYSAQSVPYFMLVTTVVVGLFVAIQLHFSQRLTLCRVMGAALLVFAGGTLAFSLAISSRLWFAVPAFYVWAGVFGVVTPMSAWSIISRRLLTRYAKRAIGIIGAGGIAGAIGGGLIAERVAVLGNTEELLPTAALVMILTLVPVVGLGFCPRIEESEEEAPPARPLRRAFVTAVLLVIGIGSIVSTFSEFQFKVIAQSQLSTAANLTAFFGLFYAYQGVVTLAFQLIATPLLIRRLGVVGGLATMPGAMMISNWLVLTSGSLWSAVVLRGSEQLFKHSVDRSSVEVLYTAVTGAAKVRLKSLVDAVGVQAAESVGGAILIAVFSLAGLPLSTIAIVSIVFIVCWLGGVALLRREYRTLLSEVIERDEVAIDDLKSSLFGPDFNRIIPALAQRTSARTWLHLLELIDTGHHRGLGAKLAVLLSHTDPEVRRKTLAVLASQAGDYSAQAEELLADPDQRVRTEAIRYICSRSPQPVGRLFSFIQSTDPSIQVAACSCSLIQNNPEARETALTKLWEILERSFEPDRPNVRQDITMALPDLAVSDKALELAKRLLADPSLEVRRAAVKNLSRTSPQEMIPLLLSCWKETALWADLRAALAGYGDSFIPHLRSVLPDPAQPTELKKLLLQVASDIGTDECVRILVAAAASPNLTVRFAAIKGLNRLRQRRDFNGQLGALDSLLHSEISALEANRRHAELFLPQAGGLLERVFTQRRRWGQERIFRLLALVYDTTRIRNAYLAFESANRQQADTALELLDSLLDQEHARRVLPLLEGDAGPGEVGDRKAVFLEFISQGDDLAASAALLEMMPEELEQLGGQLETNGSRLPAGSLISETLHWRYMTLQPKTTDPSPVEQALTTIQKLEALSKVDIFQSMGPHELLMLANRASVQDYGAGEEIYKIGETAHHIYCLTSGTVELRRESDQLERIRPGMAFGVLAVLSRKPRFFSAVAVEPARCVKVDRETFWEMIEDYPTASRAVFEALAGQILSLMGRLAEGGDSSATAG